MSCRSDLDVLVKRKTPLTLPVNEPRSPGLLHFRVFHEEGCNCALGRTSVWVAVQTRVGHIFNVTVDLICSFDTGGLFHPADDRQEVAFRYAVERINDDRSILPRARLTAQIERISPQDSFHASKRGEQGFGNNKCMQNFGGELRMHKQDCLPLRNAAKLN